MNTPNPLVPQGSLQEQSKRKSRVSLIVFSILAVHVLLLGALLIQGCKRDDQPSGGKIEPVTPPPTSNTDVILPPPPPPVVPPPTPPATTAVVTPLAPLPIIDTAADTAKEHVIAKGETFAVLAKKYGLPVKAIQQANPGVDPTKLKIGQKINIPPKPPAGALHPNTSGTRSTDPEVAAGETVYTVKKSDTLASIARTHGVRVKAIRSANNLRTDQIKVGQKLKMPAKGAASTTSTASTATPPPPVFAPPATSAPVTPTPTAPPAP